MKTKIIILAILSFLLLTVVSLAIADDVANTSDNCLVRVETSPRVVDIGETITSTVSVDFIYGTEPRDMVIETRYSWSGEQTTHQLPVGVTLQLTATAPITPGGHTIVVTAYPIGCSTMDWFTVRPPFSPEACWESYDVGLLGQHYGDYIPPEDIADQDITIDEGDQIEFWYDGPFDGSVQIWGMTSEGTGPYGRLDTFFQKDAGEGKSVISLTTEYGGYFRASFGPLDDVEGNPRLALTINGECVEVFPKAILQGQESSLFLPLVLEVPD